MKHLLLIILLCLSFVSNTLVSQYGWIKIYDQQNYGILRAQIFQSQNLSISSLYIQLSYNNAQQNNDAGRVYKLNKSSLQFYTPFQNGFDRLWLFRSTPPPPHFYFQMQNPFAVSLLDTNFALTNYVSGCGWDCGDHTYYSTNYGTNWTLIPGLGNDFIGTQSRGFDIDPKNPNIMYSIYPSIGASNRFIVYKSSNKGLNWVRIDSINTSIRSIPEGYTKINPFRINYIYTRGWENLIISTNSGMNFDTAVGSASFGDIKFNRVDSSMIAYSDNKLYKSTNHGFSWSQISTLVENIRSIVICYDNPNSVYAGTSNGLYKSNNGGVNWTWYNNSFTPSKNVIGINSDAGMGDTVYAVTNDAVYRVWHSYTGLNNVSTELPSQFSLSQNYPNPFNPTTNIKFNIPKSGFVKLTVFDVLGKEIQTLVNEQLSPGSYSYDFDASHLPSGIYYYKIESNEFTQTKKMVLIK